MDTKNNKTSKNKVDRDPKSLVGKASEVHAEKTKGRTIDITVLVVFCVVLVGGVVLGLPIPAILVVGFALLFVRGLTKSVSVQNLLKASWSGIRKALPVIITLFFIGALAAVWRACGTIPFLIVELSPILLPQFMPLACFVLCAVVSGLMGSAFGTAATAGVISIAVAQAMGCNVLLCGGAALSGCFFGDRNSPISTSALLIATLTHTNQADNIRTMFKVGIVPVAVCLALYAVCGFVWAPGAVFGGALAGETSAVQGLDVYRSYFTLSWFVVVPALSVVVLSLVRVNITINVAVSCVLAAIVCVVVQGCGIDEVLRWMVLGFEVPEGATAAGAAASAASAAVAGAASTALAELSGGGIISMATVLLILIISSTFAGLLEVTGMIDILNGVTGKLCETCSLRGATVIVSIAAAALACNQALAIMLSHRVLDDHYDDKSDLMIALEDTVVTIAAIIPWSIAVGVPCLSMGISLSCILTAFLLYAFPLWELVRTRFFLHKAR